MRRHHLELGRLVIATVLAAACTGVRAQPPGSAPAPAGLEPPPAVAPPPPPPRTAGPGPGGAVLAPLPASTHEGIEEIVVVGPRSELPDLGSSFRAPQPPARRFEVTVLPLYDPEAPEQTTDLFSYTPENQRIHNIELFRVRFGHRAEALGTERP